MFPAFARNKVTALTKEDIEHVERQKSVFFELGPDGIEFVPYGREAGRSTSDELGTSSGRG